MQFQLFWLPCEAIIYYTLEGARRVATRRLTTRSLKIVYQLHLYENKLYSYITLLTYNLHITLMYILPLPVLRARVEYIGP